jgi:DNA-binding GntR family transcriptional regulator
MRAPHRGFHRRLVAGCGTGVAARLEELADHAERYRLGFGGFDAFLERRAEHRAILDAATAGDPDLAAERLVIHYARAAVLVFEGLDPDHDLRRLLATIRTVAPKAESALELGG